MNGVIRPLLFVSALALLSGCKLAIMVPSEGNVVSASGTRDCNGPGYCEFDITESSFSDTFTAVPRPGFEFVAWQDGSGFFCADVTAPACTVEMPNEAFGAFVVALFRTGLIRPVFSNPEGVDTDGDGAINALDDDDDNDGRLDEFDDCPLDGPDRDGLGCPVLTGSDWVRVNDKYWAQPNLFEGISWYEINDACPGPLGICSGKLRDVDVTGWTWAGGDEVTALLNGFMGTSLGAFPEYIFDQSRVPLSPNIFQYFWPLGPNDDDWETVYAWIREEANIVEGFYYGISCDNSGGGPTCGTLHLGAVRDPNDIHANWNPKFDTWGLGGAWLYRPVD